MASRFLQRLAPAAVLIGAVSLGLSASAEAKPTVPRTTRASAARRGFNLFAGATNVVMNVNRVQCNINNIGETCVDPTNSPVLGGGFWPKGSPDQYIFNAGLQIAAIIPGAKTATFNWPGDTVGAFFFDPRGDQTTGEARTNTFSSLSTDDLANWPTAAYANDTSLFATSLIGRANVSQQDTWARFWDGNQSLAAGARKHPMGILVEERGMAWNFPSGNQDILYFIVKFINITSGTRSDYDGLAASGYSTTDIDDIFAIAQDFRARSQAAFNVTIPAGGFAWSNVYASFAEDPDVGNASLNYSNANLVFNMAMVYKSNFSEPTWQYPPSIFGAPFSPNPGFEAAKYLATPGNLGITIAGNTTNGAPFPDAQGVSRLWRNLSGNLLPTDGSCSVPNPQARRFCQWVQTPTDTRFYAASGPFSINPGQLATTVVALVHAAPVGSSPAATPGVGPALPAFSLAPFINGDMKPGLSIEGSRIATGADTIRNMDRAAGWLTHADPNANGIVEQSEVTTVPRSLFSKALVAQSVFNNKFLLPFAPEVPQFFLVPGDNLVTVAWQKSNTETIGDPFFAVASQPIIGGNPNPLYDPNFRKFDVEGYRIWRGRTQSEMQVIASFDYSTSTFVDYTSEVFNGSFPNCAPELGAGFNGAAQCGTTYTTPTSAVLVASSNHTDYGISGNLMQVPPGGRVQLANGTIFILSLDTAVVGGASGMPALNDNDVPFAYADHGVRNGFTYVYAVTAFDVNSLASGPTSLESPLVTKRVTPRAGSGQETPGTATLTFTGRGTVLDPGAPPPSLDPATGIFSGPMPPSDGIAIGFASFLPYTASGQVALTVDSVIPSLDCAPLGGTCTTGKYYVTTVTPAATTPQVLSFVMEGTTGPSADVGYTYPPIPFLNSLAGRFGGDSTYSLNPVATISMTGAWFTVGQGRATANGIGGRLNGPRWWAGSANEALVNPNGNVCAVASSGGCVDTVGNANASAAGVQGGKINGVLPNIQYLWSPYGYLTVTNPMRTAEILLGSVARAADFKVYWNATTAGKVDSVIDVTHNVVVPFSTKIRASWGILNDSSFTNTPVASTLDGNNGFLTFTDMFCVDPIPTILAMCGSEPAATSAFLMNHAISNPMNFKPASTSAAGGAALVAQGATGNGFIFYLNGKFFVMQMTSTLAACCQNTVWNARFYAGYISGGPGSFAFTGETRPPAVPGLSVSIAITGSTFNTSTTNDSLLSNVHTVPDPYYVTNSLELTSNTKVLRFVNLPSQAIIRIYSASGILVNILSHNDAGGGGEAVWNLRNRNNQFVASGVYFYHVEGPDGHTKVGRFTVVNYAQ